MDTTTERMEVERTIAADPATIFRVLSDPRGHVAIDSSGMLMSATGDPVTRGRRPVRRAHGPRGAERLPDGALRRDGDHHEARARPRDRVDDRRSDQAAIGHVYGYTLAPVEGGTLVTSYYDWSEIDPTWKEAAVFPIIPESALRATLGILARTVAAPA